MFRGPRCVNLVFLDVKGEFQKPEGNQWENSKHDIARFLRRENSIMVKKAKSPET